MSATPFRERWDAVLFDLDGTIADTVPLILASFRHTMTVHRGAPRPDEEWLAHVGRPLRDSMAHFAEDAEEAVRMRETYVAFQREHHDRMVKPFTGIREVVEELLTAQVPVGIVTSKAREMTGRTLEVCKVAHAFPVVVTADDVMKGKPDPEPLYLALEALGAEGLRLARERTLFIGDSPHDVNAGHAAGVRTVAVGWGAASPEALQATEPDYFIRDPGELLGL